MTVHFTADLHLGHAFVATTLRRFPSVEAHDDFLAARWAGIVRPDDLVYVLGDLTLEPPARAVQMLAGWPGRKRLVLGNHDRGHPMHRKSWNALPVYAGAFESVATGGIVSLGGTRVLLSHFPYTADHTEQPRHAQWRLPDLGRPLLHGHTHALERFHELPSGTRELHVGLDAWALAPVSEGSLTVLLSAEWPDPG